MKRLCTIACLLIAPVVAGAQEFVYTLNQYTPLLYNPAHSAVDNYASIGFLNRRASLGSGIIFQNNVFNGDYPLIEQKTGKRFGGIGVHVVQKDAGVTDLLHALTLGLSAAYNLPVAKDQFLAFGLQANYNNKQTSLQSLTTGSQWLANEFRFDPSADLGESVLENRVQYLGFHGGLFWYHEDRDLGVHKTFAGIAAFHLNRPDDSFIETGARIPLGFQFNAGALLYHSSRIQLTPQLIYQRDNHSNVVSLLVSNKILFANENPYDIIRSGDIELLGKLGWDRDMSLGIVLHQPGLSVGFSYNFPLSSRTEGRYFRDATEFGVRLSKAIWEPKPARVVIDNPSTVVQRRQFNFNEAPRQSAPVVKSDVDVIQENIKELTDVRAVQFQLEKDFKFGFGEAALNAEAKVYLEELYRLLEENPEYNVEVIGHTDNVGRPQVNYRLSLGRAEVVAAYLRELGVEEGRIRAIGRGDTEPKAENDSDENRALNRRVEFVIYVNR